MIQKTTTLHGINCNCSSKHCSNTLELKKGKEFKDEDDFHGKDVYFFQFTEYGGRSRDIHVTKESLRKLREELDKVLNVKLK